MPVRLLIVLLVLAAFCPLVADRGQAEPPDCTNAGSTVEINVCADKDYRAADEALNAVYKRVLERIADSGSEPPYDRAGWERTVREAQRAWIAFRDADCKGAVPMEWSGGTGTTAAVLGCLREKTEARTKDLKERYGIE